MKRMIGNIGVGMLVLLIAAFAFIAIRGMLDPTNATARFGMPTTDPAGIVFYRVYLSRNLVIVLIGIVLIALRSWRPLAIMMTCAIALPLFDTLILYAEHGSEARLFFHVLTFLVLSVTSICLWLKASETR